MTKNISHKVLRTEAEAIEDEDALFALQRNMLSYGSATESQDGQVALIAVDEQAARLVSEMTASLRAGRLAPRMANLLADYLDALDSEGRWKVLGLSNKSRRLSAAGEATSAMLGYTDALSRGASKQEAESSAYDAHEVAVALSKGAPPSTYDSDSRLPATRYVFQKSKYKNLAKKKMSKTVMPKLKDTKLFEK